MSILGAYMQFTVQQSTACTEQVEQLREIFAKEWGHIDSFDGWIDGIAIPRPLTALGVKGELLGGLAFTAYKHPSTEDSVLWVNALLVIASQRRNGIGTRLIQEVGATSQKLGFAKLHVYTNVARIYQRLGWCIVSVSGQYSVLASAV